MLFSAFNNVIMCSLQFPEPHHHCAMNRMVAIKPGLLLSMCSTLGQRMVSALLWVGATLVVVGLVIGIAYGATPDATLPLTPQHR